MTMNHILIITSDSLMGVNITKILSNNSFQVTEVATGFDGLLMICKNTYEAIVIDEGIPDIDSDSLCRKTHEYADSPIILLGSAPANEVWPRVEDLGFNIYLKKPINPDEIATYIISLLRSVPSEPGDELIKRNADQIIAPLSQPQAVVLDEDVNILDNLSTVLRKEYY